jgi:hypothetical protein
MLSEKTHEPQRQTIVRLLADEETKYDALCKLEFDFVQLEVIDFGPRAISLKA